MKYDWFSSHQVFCCSIFSFLCSALLIIVCFFYLGLWIVCTRFDLQLSISALRSPKFWILHAMSFDWRLVFHFGISWLPLPYFLISPFVPSDSSLISSNYSLVFFWSLLWYLLIIFQSIYEKNSQTRNKLQKNF